MRSLITPLGGRPRPLGFAVSAAGAAGAGWGERAAGEGGVRLAGGSAMGGAASGGGASSSSAGGATVSQKLPIPPRFLLLMADDLLNKQLIVLGAGTFWSVAIQVVGATMRFLDL